MAKDNLAALGRRIIEEVINGRKLELLDELVADDYVENTPLPPGWPEGREGLRRALQEQLNAFPDFRYTIEDEVVEGNKLAHRLTAHGTHTGEFLGIPPTGKYAEWSEMHMGTVRDGKFIEHTAITDRLGMMQQLGLIPTPEPATA